MEIMRSLMSDLRYAARELRRRPGFTLTAVLSLALGIAATTDVFSVIYGILIDPWPYPGSDRMMVFSMLDKAGRFRGAGFNTPQMDLFRKVKSIESVVGMDGWNLTTTDSDLPEDVAATYITPNA